MRRGGGREGQGERDGDGGRCLSCRLRPLHIRAPYTLFVCCMRSLGRLSKFWAGCCGVHARRLTKIADSRGSCSPQATHFHDNRCCMMTRPLPRTTQHYGAARTQASTLTAHSQCAFGEGHAPSSVMPQKKRQTPQRSPQRFSNYRWPISLSKQKSWSFALSCHPTGLPTLHW